jgi:pyruvate dehydrogenase E2 component (dihydrolipoamide acetyltransferase)
VVPVIRDADRKSLTKIGVEAHDLIEQARAGTLTPNELIGSTFTISNLGMYGIDHFTAVINPPEARSSPSVPSGSRPSSETVNAPPQPE